MSWATFAIKKARERKRVERAIKSPEQVREEGLAERQRITSLLEEMVSHPNLIDMFEELSGDMREAGLVTGKPNWGYYGKLEIYPREAIKELPLGVAPPANLWQDDDGGYWSYSRPILGNENKRRWGNQFSTNWIKGDYKYGWTVFDKSADLENLIAFVAAYLPAGHSPTRLRIQIGSPKDFLDEIVLESLMQRHISKNLPSIKDFLGQAITSYFRTK
jgi:hypothetical protein